MVGACFEIGLVALISYLLGSINLSIILSKLMNKGDIRDYGSKNAGTTNALRVLGKGPALLVIIWDILKGVIAVNIARFGASLISTDFLNVETQDPTTHMIPIYVYCFGIMIASFAVILGHNYPIFFGFRGGKGVATSIGVILAIEPRIGLICLVAGIVGICIFQFVSVGSLIGAIEYPILVCIIGGQFDTAFNTNTMIRAIYILFSFVLAIMVLFRHRANIKRIKEGNENKLRFRKTPEEKIQEEKDKIEGKEHKEESEQEVNEENKDEEIVDIKFEPVKDDKKKKKKDKKDAKEDKE